MITENPINVYTGDGSGSRAMADYYLAANASGLVRCKVLNSNSQQFPLWFSPTDDIGGASEVYTGGKAVLYISAGNYFYIDNGGAPTDSGILAVIGDQYRLRRTAAGLFLAEKTSDGINWTVIHNYTYTSTAKHFVKMQTIAASKNLANPIYSGLTRRPIMLVCWGESNSGDGYADNGYLTITEAGVRNAKVFNTTTNLIEGLHIGTNNQIDHAGLTLATHGISNGIANAFDAGMFSPTPLIIVPVAQGGSQIQDWEDTDVYYTKMLSRIANCSAAIVTDYGVKPSILFHAGQGANNIIAGHAATVWKPLILDFLTRVRTAIAYNADMFYSNFAIWANGTTYSALGIAYNAALNEIVANDKRIKIIDQTGADLKDSNHLQYNGQKIIADKVAHYISDTLKIFPSVKAGYLISVKLASASPCSQPILPVYINHNAQTFSVGDVLYQDILMTTPIAGFTQVVDVISGFIYSINNTTGVVGAATGADCSIKSVDKILFQTNNALLINTADVWTASIGVYGYGHYGLDDLFLDIGENGIIYKQNVAADASSFIFGFRSDRVLGAYTTLKVGVGLIGSGGLYNFDTINGASSSNDTGYVVPNGYFVGIWKCGLCYKPVVSADAIHWFGINTYRGTLYYTPTIQFPPYADHPSYIATDAHYNGKMYYPKILKYNNVNNAKMLITEGNSIAVGELAGGAGWSVNEMGMRTWYHLDTGSGKWFNNKRAISGSSIQQHIDNLPVHVFSLVAPGFSKFLVTEYEGTNYMATTAGNQDGLTCFNKFMEFANLVLNFDPRMCVMLYTCMPSAVVPEARRLDFNARLLAITQTDRLKVCNTTTEPRLEDHTNTAYFGDGTHLTDAGYLILGDMGKVKAAEFL